MRQSFSTILQTRCCHFEKYIHGRKPVFHILTQMTKITLQWLIGPSDINQCLVLLWPILLMKLLAVNIRLWLLSSTKKEFRAKNSNLSLFRMSQRWKRWASWAVRTQETNYRSRGRALEHRRKKVKDMHLRKKVCMRERERERRGALGLLP